ncbi:MAG: carboxypeptidase-like regulatory domain-containing protein [Nitrospiria bacterium]
MRMLCVAGMVGLIFFAGAMNVWAAYEGRVVDAETKEPVAGVVVFMEWSTLEFNLMPHNRVYAEAHETLTDEEGRFSLQKYWSFNPWKLLFTGNQLTIFKSGYEPLWGGSWETLVRDEWFEEKGTFIWKVEDGKPVLLLRRALDIEKRHMDIGRVGPNVPDDKMKLLRVEMDKEYEIIHQYKRNLKC